jgi:hypothetical protein
MKSLGNGSFGGRWFRGSNKHTCKAIWNCQNESSLSNKRILIKMGKKDTGKIWPLESKIIAWNCSLTPVILAP